MEELKKKLIIVGTSTTARSVCKFVETYKLFDIIGFAVNRQYLGGTIIAENQSLQLKNWTR